MPPNSLGVRRPEVAWIVRSPPSRRCSITLFPRCTAVTIHIGTLWSPVDEYLRVLYRESLLGQDDLRERLTISAVEEVLKWLGQ